MCSTASRAECTCNLWLTDINECTENTDGCKEGSFLTQFCTDNIPEAEGERLFNCSCPAGFEVFTAAGQNGFGTVVQYGEDVDENPGDTRVIDKSCIRTHTCCLTTRCSVFYCGKLPVSLEYVIRKQSINALFWYCRLGVSKPQEPADR